MMADLKGKAGIVTGGSSGIGGHGIATSCGKGIS